MDKETERLLSLAHLAYKRGHRRREPSVVVMQRLVGQQWAAVRLNVISTWADEIQARVCHERLVSKLEVVFQLLERAGVIGWEWPWDDLEAVYTVAWGLATLRWINRVDAGHHPRYPLECADDEVQAWLEARQTRQLSLW